MADNEIIITIRGVDQVTPAANSAIKAHESISASAIAMGAALGAVYEQIGAKALEATKSLVMGFADAGAQIDILHQRTGMSTEAISALTEAAKLTGASIEGLDVGIKKMNATVFAAAEGNAKATTTFTELGLKVNDLKGLQPDAMFVTVADALAKVDSAGARSALSVAVFGKAGQQLLPMLASGKLDLAAWEDLTKKLGLSFDKDAAEGARKFHDQTILLSGQIDGLKYKIGEALMPAVSDLVTEFQRFIDQNGAKVAADIATAAGNAANAVHSMATAWADAGNILQKLNGMGISNNTLLWGALGGKLAGAPGAIAGAAGASLVDDNTPGLKGALQRIAKGTGFGAGIGAIGGAPFAGIGAGPGALVGGGVGLTVTVGEELMNMMNGQGVFGGTVHSPGAIDPKTGAPYGAGTFGPNAPAKPFFDLSSLLGDKTTDDGGFNAPPGGGSAKKSPLQTAWDKVNDDLWKKAIEAWQTGGDGALSIQLKQNEQMKAQTQDLADRMVQALGIDMPHAVEYGFTSVTDAAKATADQLVKASVAQQKFNDDVGAMVKTMDDAVRRGTATLFGQLTANQGQAVGAAARAQQQAGNLALLGIAQQASLNDAVNNAGLKSDGSNAAEVLAAIGKVTASQSVASTVTVHVTTSPDLHVEGQQ